MGCASSVSAERRYVTDRKSSIDYTPSEAYDALGSSYQSLGHVAEEKSPLKESLNLKLRSLKANLLHDINGDVDQFQPEEEDPLTDQASARIEHWIDLSVVEVFRDSITGSGSVENGGSFLIPYHPDDLPEGSASHSVNRFTSDSLSSDPTTLLSCRSGTNNVTAPTLANLVSRQGAEWRSRQGPDSTSGHSRQYLDSSSAQTNRSLATVAHPRACFVEESIAALFAALSSQTKSPLFDGEPPVVTQLPSFEPSGEHEQEVCLPQFSDSYGGSITSGMSPSTRSLSQSPSNVDHRWQQRGDDPNVPTPQDNTATVEGNAGEISASLLREQILSTCEYLFSDRNLEQSLMFPPGTTTPIHNPIKNSVKRPYNPAKDDGELEYYCIVVQTGTDYPDLTKPFVVKRVAEPMAFPYRASAAAAGALLARISQSMLEHGEIPSLSLIAPSLETVAAIRKQCLQMHGGGSGCGCGGGGPAGNHGPPTLVEVIHD